MSAADSPAVIPGRQTGLSYTSAPGRSVLLATILGSAMPPLPSVTHAGRPGRRRSRCCTGDKPSSSQGPADNGIPDQRVLLLSFLPSHRSRVAW